MKKSTGRLELGGGGSNDVEKGESLGHPGEREGGREEESQKVVWSKQRVGGRSSSHSGDTTEGGKLSDLIEEENEGKKNVSSENP